PSRQGAPVGEGDARSRGDPAEKAIESGDRHQTFHRRSLSDAAPLLNQRRPRIQRERRVRATDSTLFERGSGRATVMTARWGTYGGSPAFAWGPALAFSGETSAPPVTGAIPMPRQNKVANRCDISDRGRRFSS